MRYVKDKAYGFLLALVGVLLLASYAFDFQPIRDRAEDYLNRGIKITLASYLIVRGINAGVSVIKESELSLSPAGVGLSLALGEVLDPIDDVTERVSVLLLVSFISFGIQRLTLELLSAPLLLVSGILSLIVGIAGLLRGVQPRFVLRVLVLLLTVRFLLPLSVVAGEGIYEGVVNPRLEATNAQLSSVKTTMLSSLERVKSPSDLKNLLSSLKDGADSAVGGMLTLALYFAFQTIFLPVASLWVVVRLSLGVMRLKL
ncbi:hypothetical protein [Hydrogenivirga sp. 128-5-R1-1]|uniref:hypothetical protein n=1 Tax=Hydrogenivirga sp. 128-5-R1-1 TaxID=392423 RepID=UPI00015F380E|nr:hypothetical protein [Hydrogenivirga sp. 128-5-R1-1]EDP76533.1 hypothetical protein HG1285_02963 [Hydrogenivirga sp. 128-5-R1-1]